MLKAHVVRIEMSPSGWFEMILTGGFGFHSKAVRNHDEAISVFNVMPAYIIAHHSDYPPSNDCVAWFNITSHHLGRYGADDELSLHVFPFEELAESPNLIVNCEPECPAPFFELEEDSEYSFNYQVTQEAGAFTYDVDVQLTDLAGNISEGACLDGPLIGTVE